MGDQAILLPLFVFPSFHTLHRFVHFKQNDKGVAVSNVREKRGGDRLHRGFIKFEMGIAVSSLYGLW